MAENCPFALFTLAIYTIYTGCGSYILSVHTVICFSYNSMLIYVIPQFQVSWPVTKTGVDEQIGQKELSRWTTWFTSNLRWPKWRSHKNVPLAVLFVKDRVGRSDSRIDAWVIARKNEHFEGTLEPLCYNPNAFHHEIDLSRSKNNVTKATEKRQKTTTRNFALFPCFSMRTQLSVRSKRKTIQGEIPYII